MNSLLSYVFEMWVNAHNMGIDASKSVEIVSSLDVGITTVASLLVKWPPLSPLSAYGSRFREQPC